MKKIIKLLCLTFSLLCLAACQHNTSAQKSPSSKQATVRLIVKTGHGKTDEKVTFKEGDTVMDVLKSNYKVKEKNGFITSIDGLSQDEKAGKYWMYNVNDKLAPKTAEK